MVDIIDTKFYESNGVTQINLPDYLEYEFLYSNGINIEQNQLLAANTSRTIKVKLKFKDNLDESQLPTTDKTIVIRQSITYIQADENAVRVPNSRFEYDSWSTIVDNVYNNHTEYYNLGDTKEVDMGSFGTHTLRIANTSTPSECSNSGFSQTACGIVFEFADIIDEQKMNSSETNEGGWEAAELRTYLNNTVYNLIPEIIRNNIIDTYVVSGHGKKSGESNFITTDKLYLLSTKEVWGKEGTSNVCNRDTAEVETRQLDYYTLKGTSDSKPTYAKKHSEISDQWWLRTPVPNKSDQYYYITFRGEAENTYASKVYGIAPAFRLS